MTDEEREAIKASAREFWADPENVRKVHAQEEYIRGGVDARFYGGRLDGITTAAESQRRRLEVGLPVW